MCIYTYLVECRAPRTFCGKIKRPRTSLRVHRCNITSAEFHWVAQKLDRWTLRVKKMSLYSRPQLRQTLTDFGQRLAGKFPTKSTPKDSTIHCTCHCTTSRNIWYIPVWPNVVTGPDFCFFLRCASHVQLPDENCSKNHLRLSRWDFWPKLHNSRLARCNVCISYSLSTLRFTWRPFLSRGSVLK